MCIFIPLWCTQLSSEVKQSAGREISNSLWINLPISHWLLGLCVLLSLRLSATHLLQSLLWSVSFSVAFPWLLSQSLPLAPQSHCSLLYLSRLISLILFPPLTVSLSFSTPPPPLSLFILTPPSPPLPHSHQTHTESDAQTPSLTSPMSTLLSSCPHSGFLSGSVSAWIPSLMGPHHFRQLQFLSADKQRCGAALRTQLRGIVD